MNEYSGGRVEDLITLRDSWSRLSGSVRRYGPCRLAIVLQLLFSLYFALLLSILKEMKFHSSGCLPRSLTSPTHSHPIQ